MNSFCISLLVISLTLFFSTNSWADENEAKKNQSMDSTVQSNPEDSDAVEDKTKEVDPKTTSAADMESPTGEGSPQTPKTEQPPEEKASTNSTDVDEGIASAKKSEDNIDKTTKENSYEPDNSNDAVGNELLDLDLEDLLNIVVSSTKKAQQTEQAPSIVSVITSKDIRRRGYRTVGQAIQSVPGIYIIDDLLYSHVGVRGLFAGADSATDTIKVMINNQPISFRPTNGNFFGYELIPIEAVKRIEIVRGPGSAVFGANAFLAVINVITFKGDDFKSQKPDSAIALDGNYNQTDVDQHLNGTVTALSGWQKNKFQYFITGTFNRTDRSGLLIPGYDDLSQRLLHSEFESFDEAPNNYPSPGWQDTTYPYLLNQATSANDISRTGSAYGSVAYNPTDTIKLALDGHFQYFDKHGEFQGFSTLTHENRITYLNGFTRLNVTRTPKDLGFYINASAAIAKGKPGDKEHLVDFLIPDSYRVRQFGYLATDLLLETSYSFSQTHSLSLGVDYTYDKEDLLSVKVVPNNSPSFVEKGNFDDEMAFSNVGVFSQWLFSPVKILSLTAGVRFDYNSEIPCDANQWDCFGNRDDIVYTDNSGSGIANDVVVTDRGLFQMSARAAGVVNFPVSKLYAKALYGSSFKPPSPYQLYHNKITVIGSWGAPYLKPQSADTFEFLIGDTPIENLSLSADFYYTMVDDVVTPVRFANELVNRNADVTLYGIEADISYSWRETLSTYINANFMLSNEMTLKQRWDETDFAWNLSTFNTSLPAGMYPKVTLNFGFNIHLPNQYLNINVDGNYVGKRQASLINNLSYNLLDLHETYYFDPYVVMNLTLSTVGLEFIKNYESIISLSCRNIPGRHIEPGYTSIDIPNLGPQVYLRLEQKF